MGIIIPSGINLGEQSGVMLGRSLASDPLTGLPWFGRYQTHKFLDNTPFSLYQDVALTVPAINLGDFINGWKSVLSGIGAAIQQSLDGLTLAFEGGVPVIEVPPATRDDFLLPDMSALTEGEWFFLWKNNVISDGSNIAHLGTGTNSYLPFSGNGNTYDSFGSNTRKDNIPITYNAGYNIYNSSSKTLEWRNAINGAEQFMTVVNTVGFPNTPTLGCENADWGGGGRIVAAFFFHTVLTTDQRELVNTYLLNIAPP